MILHSVSTKRKVDGPNVNKILALPGWGVGGWVVGWLGVVHCCTIFHLSLAGQLTRLGGT